jgi:ABC-type uncharacterized transport system ATPase subunit
MHANQIIMLEHGRIVEQGTHAELVKLGGRYAHLWRLQTDQKEPEEDIRGIGRADEDVLLAEEPVPAGHDTEIDHHTAAEFAAAMNKRGPRKEGES